MSEKSPQNPADPALAPARPAATVILVRDGRDGLETLLLHRNSKLAFHGGSWVFPGGRVDAGDYPPDAPGDMEAAARRAAVREAKEEAGLDVAEKALVYFSHWTTPSGLPKRFSTWFYLAPAPAAAVEVDGGEIHDHRWMAPNDALQARSTGDIELPAPTFVSLLKLRAFATVGEAIAVCASAPPEIYVPRNQPVPGGRLSLYEGDAAYESENSELQGPRHRLWMIDEGWQYEREF